MRVVADAVGGIAEEASPQFRMVAVAHDDEIIIALFGEVDDNFGTVTGTAFAGDGDAELFCQLLDFAFALRKVVLRGFRLAFRLTRQIGVPGQRLPHPDGSQLRFAFTGQRGGAFERSASTF